MTDEPIHEGLANFLVALAIENDFRQQFHNADKEGRRTMMTERDVLPEDQDAVLAGSEQDIRKAVGFGGQHHRTVDDGKKESRQS